MHTKAREISRLDADLRRAVEQGAVRAALPAQVDARTGQIVGAEALVRWKRDEEGLVYPAGSFSRRENGLIVPINQWVLLKRAGRLSAGAAPGCPGAHRGQHVARTVPPREHRRTGDQGACASPGLSRGGWSWNHRKHRDGAHGVADP
jgi:hypothetical protein